MKTKILLGCLLAFMVIGICYAEQDDMWTGGWDPTNTVSYWRINSGGDLITGSSSADLKVGNGTPGVTQNGEDAYIEGTLEVDGAVTLDGNVTLGNAAGDVITISGDLAAASALVFEGATADAYETTMSITDPTADNTFTIPNATGAAIITALTTNSLTAANSVYGVSNGLSFEGATADAFETIISPADPTTSNTLTLPNTTGAFIVSTLTTNSVGAANSIYGVSNGLTFEGATANAFETNITPADPTAARTVTLADASGTVVLSSLATNAPDAANSVTGASNNWIFEGATADAFETSVTPTDATADNTVTLPDSSGTVFLSTLATNNIGAANSVYAVSNGLVFEGATSDAYETTVTVTDPTAARTITLPNTTGTAVVLSNAPTVDANLIFEGATANDFETTIAITDPTADRTVTVPNAGGWMILSQMGAARNIYSDTDTLAAGTKTVTFATAFSATPLVIATLKAAGYIYTTATSSTAATFANGSGSATDSFDYIAIGAP